ncbi:MAG: hypothetical protein K1Y36_14150 [Blastocatellia bacterium]|nr:hypothetical protein [Blastocatellia bacterium]
MNYPEEDIARDFHRKLVRRFTDQSPTVEGAGVHWHCTVGKNQRACRINCFDLPDGCDYFTSFKQDAVTVAYARHPSSEEALAAIAEWLDRVDLATLYDRYPFIDATKRSLERIRDEVNTAEPELEKCIEAKLAQQIGDICHNFPSTPTYSRAVAGFRHRFWLRLNEDQCRRNPFRRQVFSLPQKTVPSTSRGLSLLCLSGQAKD